MKSNIKNKVLKRLGLLYPNPKSELNFSNEYQLLVSVLLSAQCTDKKVNETTPAFFKKYPSFMHLSMARLSAVQQLLRPINYYKTKSRNLIVLSKKVVSEFKQKVPKTFKELISLPGIGQKTANVILSELGITRTFPVDTHVFRVSRRLGLARGKTVEIVEEELKAAFDSKHWRTLHHLLILHGRRICKASSPMCEKCVLLDCCPSAESFKK
jgi:endonuclease III